MQFRLHIDIPLGNDEEEASRMAKNIIRWCFEDKDAKTRILSFASGVEKMNYRLGNDKDRQKSNYLQKTENGHVTNKKCRINLSLEDK